MHTISVPGREDLHSRPKLSPDLGLKVVVKRAVRIDTTRTAAQPLQVEIAEGDLVEITLADGAVVWMKPGELDERLGFTTSRSEVGETLQPYVSIEEPSRGPARWAIEGLAILGVNLPAKGAKAVAGKFEAKVAESLGLLRWLDPGELEPLAEPLRPQAGAHLLFLHGTASHTRGSFDGLRTRQPAIWAELRRSYGDRILGFEHRTLTESPAKNAVDLLAALPDDIELHVVSHSRGGLVGELLGRAALQDAAGNPRAAFTPSELARCEGELRGELERLNDLLARKRPKVTHFVRVACPARGTVLIDGRVDRWLNLLFNAAKFGMSASVVGSEIVEALQDVVIATVKEGTRSETLPGLAAMVPEASALLHILNQPTTLQDDGLVVIAGDCEAEGVLRRIGLFFADLYFGTDHDLVVDTASMDGGARRPQLRRVLDRSPDVSHFNYFANARTARAVLDGLSRPELFEQHRPPERGRTQPLESRGAGNRPLVFVLPGISGSHLKLNNDRIWIDLLRLASGGVMKLGIDAAGVSPEAPIDRYYGELCDYLRATHDVAPVGYDWRKSIAGTAQGFAAKLTEALGQRSQPIRIVAHSMGGLVARTAFLMNPDLWSAFRERDNARLVMLGTPNGGSYSIPLMLLGRNTLMQWLHRLDLTATAAQHLAIAAAWDGALQMLPKDAAFLRDLDWWKALPRGDLPDGFAGGPSAADLRDAGHFIEELAEAPLDPACMAYVAGQADTYCGVRVVDGRILFEVSPEGDGAVLWKLGIPQKDGRPTLPTWYTQIEHGDLARRREIFPAILDILSTGTTERLARTPPAILRLSRSAARTINRDGPAAAEDEERPPLIHHESLGLEPSDDLLLARAVFGSIAPDAPPRRPPVTVRVLHCDLRRASFPVLVGHYVSDTIAGTEKILDKAQGGRIERRRRRGLHPGPIETFDVYLASEDERQISSLIVGLGPVTGLTRGNLARTLRRGLLGLADAMEEQQYRPEPLRGRGFSTVLVGSGGGVVAPSDCITAMLTALRQANESLGEHGFQELEIVEVDEQRAINAWHILRRMLSNATETFLLDGGVHSGVGGWRRVGPDTSERDWFVTIEVIGGALDTPDGREEQLRYKVVGSYARVETSIVGLRRRLVDKLIRRLAERRADDSRYSAGRALFELLWPRDLKNHSLEDRSIRLVLDDVAAGLPWEMLDDRQTDLSDEDRLRLLPPAARFKLVRQLGSTETRPPQRRAGPGRRALVIGDPRGDGMADGFPELDGAMREAERVYELLHAAGYEPSLFGRAATALEVQSAILAGSWDIIHIASHGVVGYETEEPDPTSVGGRHALRQTGIVLGGNPVEIIGPEFFMQLQTVPDLVFVNCCFLGKIEVEPALRRDRPRLAGSVAGQLIKGGVRTVVAAGWEVDDAAALRFAETFYGRLLEGRTFSTACFEARSATYDFKREDSTWGAYQCYGDADFRLPETYGRVLDSEKPIYAAPSEALSELERIVATAEVSGEGTEGDTRWLANVEKAIGDHGWSARGDVQAALGDAYRAFGATDRAIELYHEAARADEGPVPIRAVESRFELMASRAGEAVDAGDVSRAIRSLAELDGLCGETWARQCLLADCHVRQAVRLKHEARDEALDEVDKALVRAAELGGKRKPPRDAPIRGRLLKTRTLRAVRASSKQAAADFARAFQEGKTAAGWLSGEAALLEALADGKVTLEEMIRILDHVDQRKRDRQVRAVRELARLFEDLLDDDQKFAALRGELAALRQKLDEPLGPKILGRRN